MVCTEIHFKDGQVEPAMFINIPRIGETVRWHELDYLVTDIVNTGMENNENYKDNPTIMKTCLFVKQKPASAESILKQYYGGDIEQIIRSVNKNGKNIVTLVGCNSPAGMNSAFRMVEHDGEIPKVVLVNEHQRGVLRSFGRDFIEIRDGKSYMWGAEIFEINHPALANKVVILPETGSDKAIAMIETS